MYANTFTSIGSCILSDTNLVVLCLNMELRLEKSGHLGHQKQKLLFK